MEIDAKLDMSLDDLIAKTATKRPARVDKSAKRGSGKRGQAGGNQDARDASDPDVVVMDEDEAPKKGRRSDPLGVSKGGVGKTARGRGQKTVLQQGPGERSARHQAAAPLEHLTPPGNIHAKWSHDLHADDGPARPRRLQGADIRQKPRGLKQTQVLRKLIISNLNAKVDEQDLHELFGRIGTLESADLVTQGESRSNKKSTAEVIFKKEDDAREAKAKYDGVALDGDAMKIDIRGVADVERVLQSGLRVTRPSGTGPRGRGAQGRLRSA